ncbi:MAG: hypothetical protein Q8876_04740 [Bacillota bacterium]|nr:hypothetical protein [Bacillota bacterium]
MDQFDAWSVFLTTGSVLDYIRYTTIRDSYLGTGQEDYNEAQNRWADSESAEYRGAR